MSGHGQHERIETLEIYKVQADRVSNLNTSLYQIPPIFSTIIGGLWYFASTQIASHRPLAIVAFLFASAVGWAGADAVYRLRIAMNGYYKNLDRFEREFHVTTQTTHLPSTFKVLTYLLVFSAILSVVGAAYVLLGASP